MNFLKSQGNNYTPRYNNMLIKLAIIAGLVILGGMIFSTEIERFFPGTVSTLPESLSSDVGDLSTTATSFVEERLNKSVTDMGLMANETADNLIGGIENTQDALIGDSESGPLDSITGIFTDDEQDVIP